mmetsp:Transcript_49419/g.143283  ORF Transcript_49419/g.143283 Transcript_49419/m.143283 type:complete len:216 (-) Transcript_49419:399-1046(-)
MRSGVSPIHFAWQRSMAPSTVGPRVCLATSKRPSSWSCRLFTAVFQALKTRPQRSSSTHLAGSGGRCAGFDWDWPGPAGWLLAALTAFRVLNSSFPAWVLSTRCTVTAPMVRLCGDSQGRLIQEEKSGAFSLPWSFRTPPSSLMATVSSRRSPRRKPRILSAWSRSEAFFCLVCCWTSTSLALASPFSGSSSRTSFRSLCASWSLPVPTLATPLL